MCIQGDALYAAGSVMDLCREKHWKYLLTRKETRQPLLAESYRWIKVENEGFNNQKNGIYDIEHLNSRDSNAMKKHYLLTQIADF